MVDSPNEGTLPKSVSEKAAHIHTLPRQESEHTLNGMASIMNSRQVIKQPI
jgi:hypothetical protein